MLELRRDDVLIILELTGRAQGMGLPPDKESYCGAFQERIRKEPGPGENPATRSLAWHTGTNN